MSKELSALKRAPVADPGRLAARRRELIMAALAAGHSQAEIAQTLGVSRQRISQIVRSA